MTNLQIANTIREQIGHRALFWIGASNFVGDKDSLTFKVKRNPSGTTHLKIQLDEGLDLYTGTAYKIRGAKVEVLFTVESLYAEELHDFISSAMAHGGGR
jgi:hypothetical protein